MAQNCPTGTINIGPVYPKNQTVAQPLNQDACVSEAVRAAKRPVQAQLRQAMANLNLQPGKDYISYIRVVPVSVIGANLPSCSCMCGCS